MSGRPARGRARFTVVCVLFFCCALLLAMASPALAAPNGGYDTNTGLPNGGQGGSGAPKVPEPYMGGHGSTPSDNQPTKNKPATSDNTPGNQTGGSTDGAASPGGSTDTGGSTTPSSGSTDIYGNQKDPGGLAGMVLGFFKTIMGWIYGSTIGDIIKKVATALQAGILGLPAPSGPVVGMYTGMVSTMRPIILVGILVTALLLMLRTSNHDISYAGFSALPKFIGLGIAFAFLPQFMQILADLTGNISGAFLPSSDRAMGAGAKLFSSAITNLMGVGFLNILLAAAYTYFGFMVVMMALLKNILFQLLFIVGPFALASSVIPGVSHLAASWFRAVLACAAIPIFWALELGLASVIVSSPDVLFGDMANALGSWGNGIFTTVGAILVLWLMHKTPFKVLEWAFESYDSSRGPWRGIVRSVAAGLAIRSISGGMGSMLASKASKASPAPEIGKGNKDGGGSSLARRSGRGGLSNMGGGRGGATRQSTANSSASQQPARLGSGSRGQGAGGQLGSAGAGQQGAIPGGGQQRALPAASPAIEAKYLKKEGQAPGFGKPDYGNRNLLSKNKGTT